MFVLVLDETADQKAEAFKTLSKAFKATLSEAHTAAQAQQINGSGGAGAGSSPATINLSLAAYTLSLPDEGLLAELVVGWVGWVGDGACLLSW